MAEQEAYSMDAARQKLQAKMQAAGQARATGAGDATSMRKGARGKLKGGIDGRSLRATGRTEQLNIRVTPEFRDALKAYCKKLDYDLLSQFIEDAVQAYAKEKGLTDA